MISSTGTRILVKHANDRLSSDFLPRLFNHAKPDNFYRQFSSYSFVKVPHSQMGQVVPPGQSVADWKAWGHPSFTTASSLQALTTLSPKAYVSKKAEKASKSSLSLAAGVAVPAPALPSLAPGLPANSDPTDIPVFVPTPTPTVLPIAPDAFAVTRPAVRVSAPARLQASSSPGPVQGAVTPERRTVEELVLLRGMSAEAKSAVEDRAQAGPVRDGEGRLKLGQVGAQDGWGEEGAMFGNQGGGETEGEVPWGIKLASDEWNGQGRGPG